MNADKLAALNHGTIRTPIPGRQAQEALGGAGRGRPAWARSVSAKRSTPTISVQLSGVDTESIIEQARREDNQGNRIRRVRQMLYDQLGIQGEGEMEQYDEYWWRNNKRCSTVLFRNIRELPDSSLENAEEDWKLVIDFPFDEAGHGPRDDLSTIQRFSRLAPGRGPDPVLDAFVPQRRCQKDLGMLANLEHIFTGERFHKYANHLSPQDRQAAKSLLENQRSVLARGCRTIWTPPTGWRPSSRVRSIRPTTSTSMSTSPRSCRVSPRSRRWPRTWPGPCSTS